MVRTTHTDPFGFKVRDGDVDADAWLMDPEGTFNADFFGTRILGFRRLEHLRYGRGGPRVGMRPSGPGGGHRPRPLIL